MISEGRTQKPLSNADDNSEGCIHFIVLSKYKGSSSIDL